MTYVIRDGVMIESQGRAESRYVAHCSGHAVIPCMVRNEAAACRMAVKNHFTTLCRPADHMSLGIWSGWKLRIVQGLCACCRVADGTMTMEEARVRNQQLIKRQHFGRTPPDVRKFF